MWSDEQIKLHEETAHELSQILREALYFVSNQRNATEYEVSQFILTQFGKRNLRTDFDVPIVAFRENTSLVHYFPQKGTAKKLERDSLILIDLWAAKKEKSCPFSDITWMAHFGDKIPDKYRKTFDLVAKARDLTTEYIIDQLNNGNLPSSNKVDAVVRKFFEEKEVFDKTSHYVGHSIGTASPHGKFGHFRPNSKELLKEKLGYTIEPGLYFKNDFGIRSEIDFYISNDKMVITTPIQREIELLI